MSSMEKVKSMVREVMLVTNCSKENAMIALQNSSLNVNRAISSIYKNR